MYEDDYVMRMIRKLGAALAAVLAASGAGRDDEADEALEEGYQASLGPHRDLLDVVDGSTLASLIGDPNRVIGLARLCEAEAALRTRQGKVQLAQRRELQAQALRNQIDAQSKALE